MVDLNELSVSQLVDRAQSGDREAQSLLGGRYYAGAGVHQDFAAAAAWYEKAGLQGHAKAQYNLGYMYAVGEGLAPDLAAAMKWYALAAEQGLPNAQNNLAGLYDRNQQFEEAAHWYQKAADQGFASAQASLGFACSKGRGVPIDEAKAIKFYRMAAEQGYAPAQSNLGGMYADGRGTPVDPIAAVRWVHLAADQGYGPAQTIMGDFCAKGFGVPPDSAEAVKWFLRGAVQGLPESQNSLAIHYATGNGVVEDRVRAFMWFAAAASNGSSDAVQNRDRLPLDRNTEICKLISEAAAGEPEAQRDLALRLHGGDEIQQDANAAHYWLHRAAESGDPWSQTTYALLLKRSDDPEVEREKVRWLSLAAEQGDDRALFNLGLKQLLGEGTAADPELGAANVLRASLAGFADARGAIEMAKTAIPDELWPSIIERVKWPDLIFLLGPLAEGHLDAVRVSQENDDGSDDAVWLRYAREAADAMFLGSKDQESSMLDAAFGEKVSIKQIYVGRAHVGGKTHVAVTISLRNIQMANGFPVYWKPSKEGLDAVASLIGMLEARTWVRWNYVSF